MSDHPIRDTRPRTLASWRLRDSRNMDTITEPNNIGFDFAGKDIPKYKFLYTVSFQFGERLSQSLGEYGGWTLDEMGSNTFPCKSVSRPNISISYVDINSYNFRYKVATKTDFGTVTLTMYDDNKNSVHNLVSRYLDAISPIALRTRDDYHIRDMLQEFASLGPLPNGEHDGLIRAMRVRHHVNMNNSHESEDRKWVDYDYINPKIQTIALDELDMSVSDVSTISITFTFDSVSISDNMNVHDGIAIVGGVENVGL